jgi:O-antigen/teichoic acid export membrane protein
VGRIKELAGQTMVYGLGTMIPRLLNYIILTPFYTRQLEIVDYGVFTELYSYTIVLLVILTMGLETGYFKFAEQYKRRENEVYSATLLTVVAVSLLFVLVIQIFLGRITNFLEYQNNQEYITWFSYIIALDSICAIPFARLRYERRGLRFSIIRIINVLITIVTVYFLLIICKRHETNAFISSFYSEDKRLSYVFFANLIGSAITLILLFPELFKVKIRINWKLLGTVFSYSWPLFVAGLAGSLNEALDRIIFKHVMTEGMVLRELGIYGANYKVAVVMTIFIQMFRYASDPFFFKNAKAFDAKKLYADVSKYFIIFALLIFIFVNLYIDFFKYFIDKKFHEGLFIVPVILFANLELGILFNLNYWFKLKGSTLYGILIIGVGAIATIVFNIILIPKMSYFGAAIARVIAYSIMILISYFLGQRHYHIPYDLKRIGLYFFIAFALTYIGMKYRIDGIWMNQIKNTALILFFVSYAIWKEKLYRNLKLR